MKDSAVPPLAAASRGGALHSLAARQAAVTLVIALVFGIIGSLVELLLDWRTMRQGVTATMQQTLAMVRPSAAEAAYQLNGELAGRVVSGLAQYGAVRRVMLRDDYGGVLAEQERAAASGGRLAERLFGDLCTYRVPLLQGDKEVGLLEIDLSPRLVAQPFFDRAWFNGAMGLLRALAICAVVVVVFYRMIIRPLVRLSQQVSALDPAHPGAAPLPLDKDHLRDEMGVLVNSLNGLLTAFQRGLDQRDQAEAGLTALTLELECRVEQRTQALALAMAEIEQLNKRLAAENVRLGAELDVSRKIQRMILPTPSELAEIHGLDVATFMEPACEVGGDYYDILHDQGRVRIGIGDVTGHGLESGVVMLMTQSAVRTLVTSDESNMSRVLNVLNRTIYDNVQRMGSDKNLTLALLDYKPQDGGGHLRIGGQHESVIVVRDGGKVELIDTTYLGMPLGLVDEVDEFLGETELSLVSGDVVVLYTDGITEAANSKHELYGLERLCDAISRNWYRSAEEIKAAVVADVMQHIGEQTIYDDLTLIVLKQK